MFIWGTHCSSVFGDRPGMHAPAIQSGNQKRQAVFRQIMQLLFLDACGRDNSQTGLCWMLHEVCFQPHLATPRLQHKLFGILELNLGTSTTSTIYRLVACFTDTAEKIYLVLFCHCQLRLTLGAVISPVPAEVYCVTWGNFPNEHLAITAAFDVPCFLQTRSSREPHHCDGGHFVLVLVPISNGKSVTWHSFLTFNLLSLIIVMKEVDYS